MAITRFDRPGVTQHTGEYFKLNYEQLREPILKQDQEYKATQDAWDTYAQTHAAQDFLPGDLEIANQKRQDLYNSENALRESVGGDLLDPRYQQGMRSLIMKEASDDFYKDAAYNYKMYHDVYLPNYQKYMEKHGEAPRNWQNNYGVQMRGYTNATEQGRIEYSPIEARVPFQDKALDMLRPVLQKKLDNGEIRREEVQLPDGTKRTYLYRADGAKLSKDDIKEMVRESGLMSQRSYDQLSLDFNESPHLQSSYSDFSDYFENGVLESIGNILAYEWNTETFQSWAPVDKDPYSRRTSRVKPRTGGNKKKTIDIGPSVEGVYSAADPVAFPDYINTRKAYFHNSAKKRELLAGFTDTKDGQVYRVPPISERALGFFGLQPGNEEGISMNVAPIEGRNELAFNLTYKTKAGKDQTINLLGPDPYVRTAELPPVVRQHLEDALLQARMLNTEYAEIEAVNNQITEFEKRAGEKAFGKIQWEAMNKNNDAPFTKLLNEGQRKALNNSPLVTLAGAIEKGMLQNQNIEGEPSSMLDTLKKEVAPFGSTVKWLQETVGLEPSGRYEEDIFALSDMLGIEPAEWKSDPESEVVYAEDLNAFVDTLATLYNDGSLNIPKGLVDQARNYKALEMLEASGNKGAERYTQLFKDNWQYGVDFNLNKVNEQGNESGVRMQGRVVYHFNQLNTSGSGSGELFAKDANELIGNVIAGRVGGDANQRATYSANRIYSMATDKEATEDQYELLAKTDQDPDSSTFGKPIGYSLFGFSLDDEGFNVVIRANSNLPDKASNYFEIRDKDMVMDLMVKSGMGDKVALELLRGGLKSFQAGDDDPYRPDAMEDGQMRSKAVGQIGMGSVIRPVEKIMYPTVTPEGRQLDEGTLKYWSVTDQKYIYAPSMLDIVKEYMVDYDYIKNLRGPLNTIDSEMFDNKIAGIENLEALGKNKLSPTMIDVLQDIATDYRLLELPIDQIRLTDAYRGSDDELAEANPSSFHLQGNAVDLGVSDYPGGPIREDLVDYYYQKYLEFKNIGVHMQMEFDDLSDPKYIEYSKKYGSDFVRYVKHATGTHVHVQYDEAVYKKLMENAVQATPE